MRNQLRNYFLVTAFSTLTLCTCFASQSLAAQPTPTPTATAAAVTPSANDTTNAERVNTDAIKEKYWARGDESEIGVVQNRLYSKAGKIEFQIIGGLINSDPFVSTYNLGGRLGYHINEYFSVHALAWKSWASPSSTQDNLTANKPANEIGTALNTDYAKSYYGAEFQASLLYGKLSLVGKSIIYYDLHFLAGLGITGTESGNNFTQHFGVGQQFFLSKRTSILVDYRIMHYKDTLINKIIPQGFGTPIDGDVRTNWTNAISIGVGFLFGGGK
jgi:outer membrane beta-barrel protein